MTEQERRRRKAAKLKNPTPVELPSGAWRCQVMVDGSRRSVTEDDPEAAWAKAVALREGLIKQARSPGSMKVYQAADAYIESKSSVLSPSTLRCYKNVINNHMALLSTTKLDDITQSLVQYWVNDLSRHLSPKTVRNAHGFLTAILAQYRPDYTLHTRMPQKQPTSIHIPDEEQLGEILRITAGTKIELPVLLAVWLGLRMSEICGLTWSAVEDGSLHIFQAMVQGEDGPVLKGTKTTSGDRWLRLPDHIAALIDRQPHTDEFIIHMSGYAIYKKFSRICEKNGLPHFRFHDLRHAAASINMMLGIPDFYNQRRMGHATDNMLKTVYLHTIKDREDMFADKIDSYFEGKIAHGLHTKK